MTEKRFTLVYQSEDAWEHEWSIKDNQEKGDWVIIQGNGKEIVEIMNNLHEENQRLTDKLNQTALELVGEVISQGKAVEISEMSYSEFLYYRAKNGKPMELQL